MWPWGTYSTYLRSESCRIIKEIPQPEISGKLRAYRLREPEFLSRLFARKDMQLMYSSEDPHQYRTSYDNDLSTEEEESSEEEDPDEYFPPPGLLIPGFYAPPNDVAKVNGLAILFPKLVAEQLTPEPEFLPPHVLVMLDISKRHKAVQTLAKYKKAIIHMGIFEATTPYDTKHIAYTVKQFDTLDLAIPEESLRLCFMVSVSSELALLHLMDLYPIHVSKDPEYGRDECAAMFAVDYGDDYPQFEDFDEEIE